MRAPSVRRAVVPLIAVLLGCDSHKEPASPTPASSGRLQCPLDVVERGRVLAQKIQNATITAGGELEVALRCDLEASCVAVALYSGDRLVRVLSKTSARVHCA